MGKGKGGAINFIYTTGPTICSPRGATFVGVQKVLKTHGIGEVSLISISVDRATDTPLRLKAWSQQFHPDPGWTLLTGETAEVTKLLKVLQVYTVDKESHTPIVIIGNDATGKWVRAYGLA